MASLMALPGLIASRTSIAGYAGLLLSGCTILSGIFPGLIAPGTSIARYTGLLLGGRTILHGITNNSLRVDTSIAGCTGLLLRFCMALITLSGLIASGTSIAGYC